MFDNIFKQFCALVPMALNLMSSEDRETRQLVLQRVLPALVLPISTQGELVNWTNQRAFHFVMV